MNPLGDRKLTVDEVCSLAKRKGCITVNVLKYRKWRGLDACFKAAEQGRLNKIRESCAIYHFTPKETT